VPKLLDYVVPARWNDDVGVGTRVRVPLHGRSVRGWVVEDNVTPPEGIAVFPLKSVLGWGPPPAVVDLAQWAAWRWAGAVSFFLKTASPQNIVRSLVVPPALPPRGSATDGVDTEVAGLIDRVLARSAPADGPNVLRLAPTADLIDVVLGVLNDHSRSDGGVLVLVPNVGWAERLTARLVWRGYPATMDWTEGRSGWPVVVGSRAAAWSPVSDLNAVVVLDAHDESYREESAPTYSAVDVVVERARGAGVPCLLTSPCPTAVLTYGRAVEALPPGREAAGWSTVELVDRRGADPRTGMFSEEFVALARSVLDHPALMAARGPLVCLFNLKGRARLLACRNCGELARCTRCGAAVAQDGDTLVCPRCAERRPMVCASCGRLRMKTLRAGVSRLREEVAALLGTEVEEITGASADGAEDGEGQAQVIVGTEAVLHRIRRASAVAFLDIDLHLLAPRVSATDETLALLARSCRLVGPRHSGPESARLLLQTRVPDHPVLRAVVRGEPAAALADDEEVRRRSALPPFSALATVSGPLANQFVASLRQTIAATEPPDSNGSNGVRVVELSEGQFLVRAPDHALLCDSLAAVPRPSGRGLRIAVDPAAI
jgi:primosomal protein N' (replication factor Y)